MRELQRIVTRATSIDGHGRQALGPPDGPIQSVAFEGSVRGYEEQRYLHYLVGTEPRHGEAYIKVDDSYVYYTLTIEGEVARIAIATIYGLYPGVQEQAENRLAAKLRQILEKAERLAERERELAIIRAVTGKV